MTFLRPRDPEFEQIAETRIRRFHSLLLVLYLALGALTVVRVGEQFREWDGMAFILPALVVLAALFGLAVAYLCSLAVCGILFRARFPVWVASVLSVFLGPAAMVLVVRLGTWLS